MINVFVRAKDNEGSLHNYVFYRTTIDSEHMTVPSISFVYLIAQFGTSHNVMVSND